MLLAYRDTSIKKIDIKEKGFAIEVEVLSKFIKLKKDY